MYCSMPKGTCWAKAKPNSKKDQAVALTDFIKNQNNTRNNKTNYRESHYHHHAEPNIVDHSCIIYS